MGVCMCGLGGDIEKRTQKAQRKGDLHVHKRLRGLHVFTPWKSLTMENDRRQRSRGRDMIQIQIQKALFGREST